MHVRERIWACSTSLQRWMDAYQMFGSNAQLSFFTPERLRDTDLRHSAHPTLGLFTHLSSHKTNKSCRETQLYLYKLNIKSQNI